MKSSGVAEQTLFSKLFPATPYRTHYTTIAGFVSGHTQAIETLFEQILFTCDEQGLLGHELFAIDGCKMSSDASKEWSGTIKELEQKRDKIKRLIKHHMTEHKKLDANEPLEDAGMKRATATEILVVIECVLELHFPIFLLVFDIAVIRTSYNSLPTHDHHWVAVRQCRRLSFV